MSKVRYHYGGCGGHCCYPPRSPCQAAMGSSSPESCPGTSRNYLAQIYPLLCKQLKVNDWVTWRRNTCPLASSKTTWQYDSCFTVSVTLLRPLLFSASSPLLLSLLPFFQGTLLNKSHMPKSLPSALLLGTQPKPVTILTSENFL
jgi:hypothetical protein